MVKSCDASAIGAIPTPWALAIISKFALHASVPIRAAFAAPQASEPIVLVLSKVQLACQVGASANSGAALNAAAMTAACPPY